MICIDFCKRDQNVSGEIQFRLLVSLFKHQAPALPHVTWFWSANVNIERVHVRLLGRRESPLDSHHVTSDLCSLSIFSTEHLQATNRSFVCNVQRLYIHASTPVVSGVNAANKERVFETKPLLFCSTILCDVAPHSTADFLLLINTFGVDAIASHFVWLVIFPPERSLCPFLFYRFCSLFLLLTRYVCGCEGLSWRPDRSTNIGYFSLTAEDRFCVVVFFCISLSTPNAASFFLISFFCSSYQRSHFSLSIPCRL